MIRHSTPARHLVAFALLAAALAGCSSSTKPGEAKLPPAAGAGAAPRPALPSLTDDDATAAPVGGDTTGTTFPRARAEMGPPLSGVISDVAVEEGSRVKKGQVLFRLRTTNLALHLQQARAAAAGAQVNLAAAQVDFDRSERLLAKKAVEPAQFNRAKAQLDAAKAGAEQARLGVSVAQQVVGDAAVKSPIDGVVTAKLKNAGEMATMMPPTIVVVVEDHSTLELRFRLPESKLGVIAVGNTVGASFEAIHTRRDAKVVRIAPSVDLATRTVEVVAMIDNADAALRAGMLATISLPGGAPPTEPLPESKAAAPAAATPVPAAVPSAPAAPAPAAPAVEAARP